MEMPFDSADGWTLTMMSRKINATIPMHLTTVRRMANDMVALGNLGRSGRTYYRKAAVVV